MNTAITVSLIVIVGLAVWFLAALGLALVIGSAIRQADEIELGGDEDEQVSSGGFVAPPNTCRKSISEDGS